MPISGVPEQVIAEGPQVSHVGLVADDYIGMKPTMAVREGDSVSLGQLLFTDRKTRDVRFTAPAAGRVVAINRREKRRFQSLVIELDGSGQEEFSSFSDHHLSNLDPNEVHGALNASGLWTALRTRPFGKVPALGTSPNSLFVTAIDTNPLAADPTVVLNQPDFDRWFSAGLQVLSTLTEGHVYLCCSQGDNLPGGDQEGIEVAEFAGPHPSGLVGTHIHFLDPVDEAKTVWHIGYQDVVAVGHLFLTGRLLVDRTISVGGPATTRPLLCRTRIGASLDELTAGNCNPGDNRIISGSVLSGRQSIEPTNFLGRFHLQVSILAEGRKRELLGWALPGFDKFSVVRAFASTFSKMASIPFTTTTGGSVRAIVPIGMYERVMPLDILATPLLKSLLVEDVETAQLLGCLELEEEDLALCSFACPGKNEYGTLLRRCLTQIEAEG